MTPLFAKSKYPHLRRNGPALERLIILADILGFKVVFRWVKEMKPPQAYLLGLMCPDIMTIYLKPDHHQVRFTLAHEIGHILNWYLGLKDTDKTADTMARSLLKSLKEGNYETLINRFHRIAAKYRNN